MSQHMQALERANAARLGQADVKRELRIGDISMGQALVDPRARTLRLSTLLLSQHRWGRGRVAKTCSKLRISENRPVGSLTERERGVIAEACR